jgi:uncharacterized oxidoreductase
MKLTGNTTLITGGASGIGRGLAEAFQALGNKVIIASRREHLLKATIAANPGMEYLVLDQESVSGVQNFANQVLKQYPKLNVLINNAGIQRVEDLTSGELSDAEATININLLGPIRLTAALIRQLMSQPYGAILNVSSSLAIVPGAGIPTYCATKAAIHSYTQSLRFQLKDTSIQVIELMPPWVQTELQGDRGMNPKAMPLNEFISEVMSILTSFPETVEIVAERAKPMRFAERGDYDAFFTKYNEGWVASQKR